MSTECMYFGGGCFWCMEAVFRMLRGVTSVTSGYIGGTMENPTYEAVCAGNTGHVEAVKVEFDPRVVTLRELLSIFFSTHDPTTPNRQGHDIGTQYRSAVFFTSSLQEMAVREYVNELTQEKIFSHPIVTEILPATTFYPAETYHQRYFENHPEEAYCQAVINPKLQKLRASYALLLK